MKQNVPEASIVLLMCGDSYVLQHRDDIPGINNPGKFSLWGGAREGEETPLECAYRELCEETSLRPTSMHELAHIASFQNSAGEYRHAYMLEIETDDFEVYEGQGSVTLTSSEVVGHGAERFSESAWRILTSLM